MPRKEALEWMLWRVDDDQKDLPPLVHLIQAVQYYTEKYGAVPNRCAVPPIWSDTLTPPDGIQVEASTTVTPGYLRVTADPHLNGGSKKSYPFSQAVAGTRPAVP